jgi:hypothetical protein
MNKAEEMRYYCKKFSEIPLIWFPKAREVFDQNLSEEWRYEAKQAVKEMGLNNWFNGSHFYAGMWIRNKLRDAGMLDQYLPDGNWDDYYVPLLEWWLGFRILA